MTDSTDDAPAAGDEQAADSIGRTAAAARLAKAGVTVRRLRRGKGGVAPVERKITAADILAVGAGGATGLVAVTADGRKIEIPPA